MSKNAKIIVVYGFLTDEKQEMQLNICKLHCRKRVDLTVLAQSLEVEHTVLIRAVNRQGLTCGGFIDVLYRQGTDSLAFKGEKIRIHIGIVRVVHMPVQVSIAVGHGEQHPVSGPVRGPDG